MWKSNEKNMGYINNQPVLVLWVLYIAVRSKCSDILLSLIHI